MFLASSSRYLIAIVLFSVPIQLFNPAPVFADSVILELSIGDITVSGPQQSLKLPIYLTNLADSIGGFELILRTDRPDLITFHNSFIAEGCLTEGWDYQYSRIVGDNLTELKLAGVADWITPISSWPAIYYPQTGAIPLVYFMIDISQAADSQATTAHIKMIYDKPTDLVISDEVGITVGTSMVDVSDTTWFGCITWDGENCIEYGELDGPPGDYFQVYWYLQAQLDPALSTISPGSIEIGWLNCGDLIGDNTRVNLADITALISFVYLDSSTEVNLWAANVDGSLDGKINLADITSLIGHVYIGTGPLSCE